MTFSPNVPAITPLAASIPDNGAACEVGKQVAKHPTDGYLIRADWGYTRAVSSLLGVSGPERVDMTDFLENEGQ